MNHFECPYCGSQDYVWVQSFARKEYSVEVYQCEECSKKWQERTEDTLPCGNCGDEDSQP